MTGKGKQKENQLSKEINVRNLKSVWLRSEREGADRGVCGVVCVTFSE